MKKHLFLPFALTILLVALVSFKAEAQTTQSSVWAISSVEIHQVGARVEHKGLVHFTGEPSIIEIRGIASDIKPKTIQVDLPHGVSLKSLTYRVAVDGTSTGPQLAQMTDSIAMFNLRKKVSESLLQTLNEERAFLQANRKISSSQEVLLVDDVIEMADFLRERNQDLGLDIIDVEGDIHSLVEKIRKLQYRKELLLNAAEDSAGVISMELSSVSAKPKSAEVSVKYLTKSARWTPEYEVFYEESEVYVKRNASISQDSGVDWDGVEVILVSGRPAGSLSADSFEDWVLEPQPQIAIRGSRASSTWTYTDAMSIQLDEDHSFAGNQRYSFPLEDPTAIGCEGFAVRVELDDFILDGEIRYYAAPAVSPEAYATVRCANWMGNKLMYGKAQVMAGNSYLGSFLLTVPTVGDTLILPLGADPHVMCSRELSEESSSSSFFGGKREVVQTWKLSVVNSHTDAITVNLVDKLPRPNSRDGKIEVSATASDGGVVNNVTHEVEYLLNLAPLEKKTVTLVITVRYPNGMKLKNL
jgi:hypothetical protein